MFFLFLSPEGSCDIKWAAGQNSCPHWDEDGDNGLYATERCTIAMWEEKYFPGVDPDTLK